MNKGLLIASFVGFVAFAGAQPSQLLRIKTKAGQSYSYLMTVQQGAGAQSMKIGFQMTMKIAKVQSGQFTMNTTMGEVTMNGQPAPPAATVQLKKLLVVSVLDSRGRILKSETRGVPGMSDAANQGSSVPFPEKAVKVGGTWVGEADIQGQKVKTTYKLIAFKPVAGKQAAVIHAVPSGMKNFVVKGPIVFSVELATGFPLSMSMAGTATQGTSTQNVAMTMRRL
ncbi:MAG: hypothetical protein H7Y17_10380 [Chlorobia bacterium]|nr:hypothetical protein [Fimbriimonadaceae bacterium]